MKSKNQPNKKNQPSGKSQVSKFTFQENKTNTKSTKIPIVHAWLQLAHTNVNMKASKTLQQDGIEVA